MRKQPEEGALAQAADYLACSAKFVLAASSGVAFGVATLVTTFFPGFLKGYDPGIHLLVSLAAPMAVTAVGLMIWARRRRKERGL